MMNNIRSRNSRLILHITPQQNSVLCRASRQANKSLAEFILDSACQVAEQTLLNDEKAHAFAERLDRPAQDNPGLKDLLSRPAPWST